jgi:hypothetical protein
MNISRMLTAQDQTSVLRVTGSRRACSGEQYSSVIPPTLTAMLWPLGGLRSALAIARALAKPKSVSFTVPSLVIMKFDGLTS